MKTTAPRSNATISRPEKVRPARHDEEYLTVAEIATLLRVSKMTIHRLIDAGEIPGTIRVGRSIRVAHSAFQAYLAGAAVPEQLALAPMDVAAVLDSMAVNDHCTHARHVEIKLVRARIEQFAGEGGLTLTRSTQ